MNIKDLALPAAGLSLMAYMGAKGMLGPTAHSFASRIPIISQLAAPATEPKVLVPTYRPSILKDLLSKFPGAAKAFGKDVATGADLAFLQPFRFAGKKVKGVRDASKTRSAEKKKEEDLLKQKSQGLYENVLRGVNTLGYTPQDEPIIGAGARAKKIDERLISASPQLQSALKSMQMGRANTILNLLNTGLVQAIQPVGKNSFMLVSNNPAGGGTVLTPASRSELEAAKVLYRTQEMQRRGYRFPRSPVTQKLVRLPNILRQV